MFGFIGWSQKLELIVADGGDGLMTMPTGRMQDNIKRKEEFSYA